MTVEEIEAHLRSGGKGYPPGPPKWLNGLLLRIRPFLTHDLKPVPLWVEARLETLMGDEPWPADGDDTDIPTWGVQISPQEFGVSLTIEMQTMVDVLEPDEWVVGPWGVGLRGVDDNGRSWSFGIHYDRSSMQPLKLRGRMFSLEPGGWFEKPSTEA